MVTLNAADTQKYLKSFADEIALIQAGTSIGYHINSYTGRLCIRSGGQSFTVKSGYKAVTVPCATNLILTHTNRHTVGSLDMPLPNKQSGSVGTTITSLSKQYIVPNHYDAVALNAYHCSVAVSGASSIRPFGSIKPHVLQLVRLNDLSENRKPTYISRPQGR